jgi:all-trans-8'-apo-beta-carotenal 15,15'-oxygenase
VVAEEPLLIAASGNNPQRLVTTWLDYRTNKSGISLFNSENLATGPIAQASMDRMLPLGFHGCWLES